MSLFCAVSLILGGIAGLLAVVFMFVGGSDKPTPKIARVLIIIVFLLFVAAQAQNSPFEAEQLPANAVSATAQGESP